MGLRTWVRAQWDRVLGAVLVAAGLVVLYLGYRGVADTAYPAEQLSYIVSGGVFGLVLVGLGATSWLSADLRDEWRKLDGIEDALRGSVPPAQMPPEPDTTPEVVAAYNGASPRRTRLRAGPSS